VSKIINDLRKDHQNLAKLWDLLGRELKVFKEGGIPDYDLVESILDYNLNYPDLCHHPKENLVFEKLIKRDPAAESAIGNLKEEHEKLSSLTWRFSTAVANVLEDEQLPREWFLDVANEFLSFSRNHMQMEEVLFFPAALKTLTAEDWNDLEDTYEKVDDPLFNDQKQEKYQALYKEIMDWGEIINQEDSRAATM